MFTNLNLKIKTQKLISLSLTLGGIICILASNYIGIIAIRLAMIIILLFCSLNMKMTYQYLSRNEKLKYLLIILSSIIGLFKPEFTMIIIGVVLLFFTIPPYIKLIKTKDYSEIAMLIIYGVGILFASYCIINAQAALNTVIKIIGTILTIAGCISLYSIIIDKDLNDNSSINGFDDNMSS